MARDRWSLMQAGRVDIPSTCVMCGCNLSRGDDIVCGSACEKAMLTNKPGVGVPRCPTCTGATHVCTDGTCYHCDGGCGWTKPLTSAQFEARNDRIEELRALLASLPVDERCDAVCPGWAVFDRGGGDLDLEVCDSCWAGRDDKPFDDDIEMLPEAQEALRAERAK